MSEILTGFLIGCVVIQVIILIATIYKGIKEIKQSKKELEDLEKLGMDDDSFKNNLIESTWNTIKFLISLTKLNNKEGPEHYRSD